MTNVNEIWLPIPGFEGRYEISNQARIRSNDFVIKTKTGKDRVIHGRIMKPTRAKCASYWTIGLKKGKVQTFITVHRVVAQLFIPNPENYPVVNHINSNKDDNTASNLEWCTQSYNLKHSFLNGRKPNRNQLGKKGALSHRSKPIFQYTKTGELVKQWDCAQAAKEAGFNNCKGAASGRQKYCKGFIWSRAKL